MPQVFTNVFDGTSNQFLHPREANSTPKSPWDHAEVGIVSGDMESLDFRDATMFNAEDWAVLLGHGILPTKVLFVGNLREKANKEDFYYHGEGIHAGRRCLVLRTHADDTVSGPTFFEFWVDSARHSAVVRCLHYSGTVAWTDLDIGYQSTDQGWLPVRWMLKQGVGPNGSPAVVDRVKVTELILEPECSDSDFKVDIKPGMLVLKTIVGAKPGSSTRLYKVDEHGGWQEVVDGVERRSFSMTRIALIVLMLIVAGVLFARIRRRRAATS